MSTSNKRIWNIFWLIHAVWISNSIFLSAFFVCSCCCCAVWWCTMIPPVWKLRCVCAQFESIPRWKKNFFFTNEQVYKIFFFLHLLSSSYCAQSKIYHKNGKTEEKNSTLHLYTFQLIFLFISVSSLLVCCMKFFFFLVLIFCFYTRRWNFVHSDPFFQQLCDRNSFLKTAQWTK